MSKLCIQAAAGLLLVGLVAVTTGTAQAWPRGHEMGIGPSHAFGSQLSRQDPASPFAKKKSPKIECYADCIFGGMTNGFCAKSCGRIF
jgi:hypothetical protein